MSEYYEQVKNGGHEVELNELGLGDEEARQIAPALMDPTTLVLFLDLIGNGIGDEGATAIANALEFNSTLEELLFDDNIIGVGGATAIAEALKTNSTLQDLSLCNNKIKFGGATAIAEALKINSALQVQWNLVSNINIGVDTARAIAEAFRAAWKSCSNLKILSLGNRTRTEAAPAIEAVNDNLAPLELDLDHFDLNNIGDEGAMAIACALRFNSSLQELYLKHNNIGDEGATAIAEALTINSTLQKIDLVGNNHSPDLSEKIESMLVVVPSDDDPSSASGEEKEDESTKKRPAETKDDHKETVHDRQEPLTDEERTNEAILSIVGDEEDPVLERVACKKAKTSNEKSAAVTAAPAMVSKNVGDSSSSDTGNDGPQQELARRQDPPADLSSKGSMSM